MLLKSLWNSFLINIGIIRVTYVVLTDMSEYTNFGDIPDMVDDIKVTTDDIIVQYNSLWSN